MSAPTSPVDICNLALDLLKEGPITDITTNPSTPTEVLCARWYDAVRRMTLRKHPWNFAITRIQLAANATAPVFGFANAYDLPSDFIRLISIGDDYLEDLRGKYQLEDNQLLYGGDTSTDALDVRYVYDHTAISQWDTLFIDVLSHELAIRLSRKITGDGDAAKEIRESLKLVAPEAYAIDGQERPPQRIQRSKWIARRRNNNSGYASKYIVPDA